MSTKRGYITTKVIIVYPNFFNHRDKAFSIGGVQTYIRALSDVILKEGVRVEIFQLYDYDFTYSLSKDFVINGLRLNGRIKSRMKSIVESQLSPNDLIVFGTESFSWKSRLNKSISIQHGIYWDLSFQQLNLTGLLTCLPEYLGKQLLFLKLLRYYDNAQHTVCVDYIYPTWARTLGKRGPYIIIPNFTEINDSITREFLETKHSSQDPISIVFARRFIEFRGVLDLIDAVHKINSRGVNAEFTFAGEGPLDERIHELSLKYENVKMTRYDSESQSDFLKDFHISVIPSLGSEGTSISILESMASGATILASNVGGITNIVIDNYNGLLVDPMGDDLAPYLEKLILDQNLRLNLAMNALNTVKSGFDKKLWEDKWRKLLNKLEIG